MDTQEDKVLLDEINKAIQGLGPFYLRIRCESGNALVPIIVDKQGRLIHTMETMHPMPGHTLGFGDMPVGLKLSGFTI